MENKSDTFLTGAGITKVVKETGRSKSSNKKATRKGISQNKQPISIEKKSNLQTKIVLDDVNEGYYSEFGVKPGVEFLKKIFSIENAEKHVKKLYINIPETFWYDGEIYYCYNDEENGGQLVISHNKQTNFYNEVTNIEKDKYDRELSPNEPMVVLRSKDTDVKNLVKVEMKKNAKDAINKEFGNSVIQRYIRCRGRNRKLDNLQKKNEIEELHAKKLPKIEEELDKDPSDWGESEILSKENDKNDLIVQNLLEEKSHTSYTKPAIIRIWYKTKFNSSKVPSYGLYISKKKFVEPQIVETTKEVIDKYTHICSVGSTKIKELVTYEMKGMATQPYEIYCEQIVRYIRKHFHLLLEEVVCDFTKDERGKIYFLGLRKYTVKESANPNFKLNEFIHDEQNLKRMYKTLQCKLCQLYYPISNINKQVTYKLLIKLRDNLAKRDSNIFAHIVRTKNTVNISCNVCDLCYKLVITELELIEIEKAIAMCMNIPVRSEEDMTKVFKDLERENKIELAGNKAEQWRIMFYFKRFYVLF